MEINCRHTLEEAWSSAGSIARFAKDDRAAFDDITQSVRQGLSLTEAIRKLAVAIAIETVAPVRAAKLATNSGNPRRRQTVSRECRSAPHAWPRDVGELQPRKQHQRGSRLEGGHSAFSRQRAKLLK